MTRDLKKIQKNRKKTYLPAHFLLGCLLLVFILTATGLLAGCQRQEIPDDIAYYTCPMHPQIKQDTPGKCPICGMTLVPVKKESLSETSKTQESQPTESSSTRGIHIDPERVQTIGVKVTEVQFKEMKKTLMIQGKVAHDPKLWVAQKEYLIALRLGDRSLIKSSEDKLYFLGLSKDWIQMLRKNRNADLGFHLPEPGKPTFFEAFVNQSDVDLIHPGEEVSIYDLKTRFLGNGTVRSLGTMVDLESRTVRALIQADRYLNLKSNTFVQLQVNLDLGKRLAVPKSAILFEGDHNMVYVETGPGHFEGRKVEIGQAAGDDYEILEGLKLGEKVVVNGQFLLDSETQMRMGTSGGHHH